MRYTSTRNGNDYFTFEQAICSGYAPDGGLFVPEKLPNVTPQTIQEWSKIYSFVDLAKQVLRLFICESEISTKDLHDICDLSFQGFPKEHDKVIPVQRVGPDGSLLFIAELFHGPTFCFKDLGMRVMINLLSHFATKRSKPIVLVVSTTGDTGPAAVQAVHDIQNPLLKILVHYPHGQISDFQRKQLTTLQGDTVRVVAFEGGGDDMDLPIKNILKSYMENSTSRIVCGVNSYNIGRPLMQMVHYIWTYLRVVQELNIKPGDKNSPIDFVIPTGAMGNIAGGYMAKCMGIPLGKLNAAVNINDVTCRTFTTGVFSKAPIMHRTMSEAINIQLPYNMERVLFYLTNQTNHELIQEWYSTLQTTGSVTLPKIWFDKLRQEFHSASVTDYELCQCLKDYESQYQYWADPHTGIALAALSKLGYNNNNDNNNGIVVAVLATASPCKFQETITFALGKEKWNEYFHNEKLYPTKARIILEKPEIPPTIYHKKKTKLINDNNDNDTEEDEEALFKETQDAWEQLARDIIDQM